jgi:hypothetical protein
MTINGDFASKEAPSMERAMVALRDLMTIAQVAMPPDLFAIDPRIIKAKRLLEELELAELEKTSDRRSP